MLRMPDFFKVLAEVQETILNWDREAESYIRGYLGQKSWGKDENWTKLAQVFFRCDPCPFPLPV